MLDIFIIKYVHIHYHYRSINFDQLFNHNLMSLKYHNSIDYSFIHLFSLSFLLFISVLIGPYF